VIDPYAAESPAEFFAVLSEAFFEVPHTLLREYPEVYRQLAEFYVRIRRRGWARKRGAPDVAYSGYSGCGLCRLAGVLYFSQSNMVYYPEIGREMVATPRQAGLDYEDVKLVTATVSPCMAGSFPASNPAARAVSAWQRRQHFPPSPIRC